MNACNLWSTWFMDAYLFINQVCPGCHSSAIATQLQPATLQSTYRTTANRIYRRNARMSYACSGLALYFYMNVGGASRTANSYSVTISISVARWTDLTRFSASDETIVIVCLVSVIVCYLFHSHFYLKENKFICNILLLRTCQNGNALATECVFVCRWAGESHKRKFEYFHFFPRFIVLRQIPGTASSPQPALHISLISVFVPFLVDRRTKVFYFIVSAFMRCKSRSHSNSFNFFLRCSLVYCAVSGSYCIWEWTKMAKNEEQWSGCGCMRACWSVSGCYSSSFSNNKHQRAENKTC